MYCFRSISRRLMRWLSLSVFFALPLASAQAECVQWAIRASEYFRQENGFWVSLYTKQDGANFHGLAESSDVTGLVDGRIEGDEFEATVNWASGSIGVYQGRVLDNGYLGGITFDRSHPESRTSWKSFLFLDCLKTASAGAGKPHVDPRLMQRQTAQMEFCRKYAKAAVAAARTWQGLSCGNGDSLWSTDFNEHLNWCIVLNGDQGQPNAKTAKRESALGSCRELAAQRRQLEDKPQVPIGEVTKPVDPLDKAGVFEK